MNITKINRRWGCFLLAVLAQFATIAYWVFRSETIIDKGDLLKFRLTGYDPHDRFRGSYLRIQFKDDTISLCQDDFLSVMEYKEKFVSVEEDENGFAIPAAIADYPSHMSIKSEVKVYGSDSSVTCLKIVYPFDRVWMNEYDCPAAERLINNAIEAEKSVYALVAVDDGEGRIVDVEINGVGIHEMVEQSK